MTRILPFCSLLAAAVLFTGCGEGTFGGDGAQGIERVETAKATDGSSSSDLNEAPTNQGSSDDLDQGSSSDDAAIGKCLAKWGNHPFGDQAFEKYRKISAAVSVLGMGKAIVDKEKTSGPSLVLISAGVSVLGKTEYDLLNPNGWYCFKVDVNVQSKTTINLACDAKLADSKVNVSVLSKSEPTAGVGVQVLSDVGVKRIGGCE